MSVGGTLYGVLSRGLHIAAPALLLHRERQGKEDPARRGERFATHLPGRPDGRVVWMHGASVGETLLLHALAGALQSRHSDISVLFTSQTATAARLISAKLDTRQLHQVAPIDAPAVARRFVNHWRPDVTVIAEGEIWPNLLHAATHAGGRLALVNARMTDKSLRGWSRWGAFARETLSAFDLVLAADARTAEGLSGLLGRAVACPGNLKASLPPPLADPNALEQLETDFKLNRPCLLAASTHPGEETLFLDALAEAAPGAKAILAPRHPERGPALAQELRARGLAFAQRSADQRAGPQTQVLLADTLGEMGVWLRLCDGVYLGGAHAKGVGGHNPVEAARLDRPVVTGPEHFNFSDLFARLADAGALQIAETRADLAASLGAMANGLPPAPDPTRLAEIFAQADTPLRETLDGLSALLDAGPRE